MKHSGKIWDWLALIVTALILLLFSLRINNVIVCSYFYVFLPAIIYISIIFGILIFVIFYTIVNSCIYYLKKRKNKEK